MPARKKSEPLPPMAQGTLVQLLASALARQEGVLWEDREWASAIAAGASVSPEGLQRLFHLGYMAALGKPAQAQAREPQYSGDLRSRTVF